MTRIIIHDLKAIFSNGKIFVHVCESPTHIYAGYNPPAIRNSSLEPDWLPGEPGDYTLVSRATDGTGASQPSETRGIVPQGATGYHRVVAKVV